MLYTNERLDVIGQFDLYTDPSGTHWQNTPKSEIPGLSVVTEMPAPTGAGIVILGQEIQIIDGVPTQVWLTRPKTADELAADALNAKNAKNDAIKAELAAIDDKSIRTLRAVLAAQASGMTPDAADIAYLANLKAQSDALRAKLV